MKYFKLSQDKRIPYSVLLTNTTRIGGYNESKDGYLSDLDRVIASAVNSSPINFYPDILDRQLYMIKGAVKEVFDLFLPEIRYKHCVMIDKPEKRCERYYIPLLDVFDLSEGCAHGNHIFRMRNTEGAKIEIVASLEVVEAILRRKPEGVRVESLQ